MAILEKVKEGIIRKIESGAYPAGSKLPPLRRLTEEFDASFMTIQRAVRALQDERFVESFVGKGTFVMDKPAARKRSGGQVCYLLTEPSPNSAENYQLEIYCGIQERCRELGLSDRALMPNEPQDALESSDTLGVISIGVGGVLDKLAARGMPVVSCGVTQSNPKIDSITPNFLDGSRLVAGMLAASGADKVHFANAYDSHEDIWFVERHLGYKAAMKEAGLEAQPQLLWHRRKCREGVEALLRNVKKGSGRCSIFAANDPIAREIVEFAEDLGLKAPDDFSIAGLEDMPASRNGQPKISTAGYDKKALGREAVSVLMRRLDRKPGEGAERLMLPMTLIQRESVLA